MRQTLLQNRKRGRPRKDIKILEMNNTIHIANQNERSIKNKKTISKKSS